MQTKENCKFFVGKRQFLVVFLEAFRAILILKIALKLLTFSGSKVDIRRSAISARSIPGVIAIVFSASFSSSN